MTTQLLNLVQEALEDKQAQEIKTIDVRELTTVTDYMVVCTATSSRHSRALCNNLLQVLKDHDAKPLGIEGEESGDWILMDCTDVIVHIMLAPTREHYQLEDLWQTTESRLVRAS